MGVVVAATAGVIFGAFVVCVLFSTVDGVITFTDVPLTSLYVSVICHTLTPGKHGSDQCKTD